MLKTSSLCSFFGSMSVLGSTCLATEKKKNSWLRLQYHRAFIKNNNNDKAQYGWQVELLVSTLSQQHNKLWNSHGGGAGLGGGIFWLPWELSFVLECYSVGEPGRDGNVFEGEWWRPERKHWTLGTLTIHSLQKNQKQLLLQGLDSSSFPEERANGTRNELFNPVTS